MAKLLTNFVRNVINGTAPPPPGKNTGAKSVSKTSSNGPNESFPSVSKTVRANYAKPLAEKVSFCFFFVSFCFFFFVFFFVLFFGIFFGGVFFFFLILIGSYIDLLLLLLLVKICFEASYWRFSGLFNCNRTTIKSWFFIFSYFSFLLFSLSLSLSKEFLFHRIQFTHFNLFPGSTSIISL